MTGLAAVLLQLIVLAIITAAIERDVRRPR
jgi:hypothetical protein